MRLVPSFIQKVLERLWKSGFEAYPVGGCVRDRLRGREPADWDLCTNALPEQTLQVFASWKTLTVGIKHGTVTVLTEGGPVEITTFRAEGAYTDGRHPDTVTFLSGLREDLARRDFTVNAMALARDGSVVDFFGGREDLASGVLRCVGEPDRRFREDGLRVLRALRFASQLDFAIEPATAQALYTCRNLLDRLAPERVFSELKGLLLGPGAGRILREYAPVLFQVLPELGELAGDHDLWNHTAGTVDAVPKEQILRLTMLFHDAGRTETLSEDSRGWGERGARKAEKILIRLHSDKKTRQAVSELIRWLEGEPPQTEKALRQLLSQIGPARLEQLYACWRAEQVDGVEPLREENRDKIHRSEQLFARVLEDKDSCFSRRALSVHGEDIVSLGVKEGPAVGKILKKLLDLVCNGEMPNQREVLLKKAAYLAEEEGENG